MKVCDVHSSAKHFFSCRHITPALRVRISTEALQRQKAEAERAHISRFNAYVGLQQSAPNSHGSQPSFPKLGRLPCGFYHTNTIISHQHCVVRLPMIFPRAIEHSAGQATSVCLCRGDRMGHEETSAHLTSPRRERNAAAKASCADCVREQCDRPTRRRDVSTLGSTYLACRMHPLLACCAVCKNLQVSHPAACRLEGAQQPSSAGLCQAQCRK